MNTSGESAEMVSYEEARFYILKLKKDEPAYSSAPSFRKALCNFGLSKTLPPDLNDSKKGFIALSILPEVARSTGKRYNPGGKLGADSETEAAESEPVEVMECVELVETFSPDATSTAVTLTLRSYNGIDIPQRPDGYINATKMCQAGGKRWSNFRQLAQTEEYIGELSPVLGIPRTELAITIQGGNPWQQGTWVHPQLATHLAQWISPKFAVIVNGWVLDILSGNHPMPNEVSHDGAIAKGIAALMDSQSAMQQSQVLMQNSVSELITVTRHTSVRVDELHDRVERIETKGRRPFKTKTERIFKAVIWKYYGGYCPVFRHIKIMDSPSVRTKHRNHTISEMDHWYANHKNSVDAGWLISAEAHKLFEQRTSSRDDYYHTFREFQRHVEEHIERTEGVQPSLFPGCGA